MRGIAGTRCRAKINLTLRIVGRREDGWHELESLVAFAGYADTLTLVPGPELSLKVDGPLGRSIDADAHDNLVIRAAHALRARWANLQWGQFALIKRLPVAAGIGGGSADAGAALRLLAQLNDVSLDDPRLIDTARTVGADVPVCLFSRARFMRGVGADLSPAVALPPLIALLVNPGVALATKAVFERMAFRAGSRSSPGNAASFAAIGEFANAPEKVLSFLQKSGNDMEDAASVLCPVIGDIIAVLSAARGCRLARMSGSGPTCFGLFADRRLAVRAATVIRRTQPHWWVKATLLR
jgi:4-diphosphocytidyl-2-C-methyl-D-erythritol kinase